MEKIYTYDEFKEEIPTEIPDTLFNHYTRLSVIEKIFSVHPQYWHISSLKGMNDISEAERYGDNSNSIFAMCFSCGKSERIPMWYMYSGIEGNGVRISFSKEIFSDFINCIDVVYPIIDGEPQIEKSLKRDTDFVIEHRYIFYCDFDNQKRITKIKYKGRKYEISKSDPNITSFLQDNYFIKDYEWEYENEYRIIFRMLKPLPKEINRIAVPINDISKRIEITKGPEFSPNAIDFSKPIKHFFEGRINESSLKIKMDMLSRNKESFLHMPMSNFTQYEVDLLCRKIAEGNFCKHTKGEKSAEREYLHV